MLHCPVCKLKQTYYFYSINKYKYYCCRSCHSLFLNPIPTEKFLNRYYFTNFKYSAGKANEAQIRKRSKIILKKLVDLYPQGKSLLDIGSGYGYFLDEAGKKHLNSLGIEPSKQLSVSDTSIKRLIEVKNITFSKFSKKSNKKFDFITVIHTIEHFNHPEDMIFKISKLLNKNGILYIETPNLKSHLFNSEKYKYTFLTPPDHIWLFSLNSFKYILKNIPGFEIAKVSTYSQSEHFMSIIKNLIKPKLNPNFKIRNSKEILSSKALKYKHKSIISDIKYLLIDKIIAPILTPLLNINGYGSILELYLRKN